MHVDKNSNGDKTLCNKAENIIFFLRSWSTTDSSLQYLRKDLFISVNQEAVYMLSSRKTIFIFSTAGTAERNLKWGG